MQLDEAKEKFLQTWGAFGSAWSISRTMAQIHALLLIEPEALSADDIMEKLRISRGNVNMNVRELMDWGLVRKEIRLGERKEYFVAEKDIWKVLRQIIIQRKKKELEPMLSLLAELSYLQPGENKEAEKAFTTTIKNIKSVAEDADKALDRLIKADEHWFFGTLMRMMR
jgi:DNA-binding transcriptional regulator GbsR (MarR family)